jgi:hypothetical protein
VEGTTYDITWKLSNSGSYTAAAAAYKAQFEGMTNSYLMDAVWKNWAPPKVKLFAWQILQNREWMADRLQKRGWINCDVCQLCRREQETTAHILFKCRYSLRIWNALLAWLVIYIIDTSSWEAMDTVKDWWLSFIYPNGIKTKSFTSLIMLASREIWLECNARVFRKVSSLPNVVVDRIKREAALWSMAGAKHLGSLMPQE